MSACLQVEFFDPERFAPGFCFWSLRCLGEVGESWWVVGWSWLPPSLRGGVIKLPNGKFGVEVLRLMLRESLFRGHGLGVHRSAGISRAWFVDATQWCFLLLGLGLGVVGGLVGVGIPRDRDPWALGVMVLMVAFGG